jgi:hypothetical protein
MIALSDSPMLSTPVAVAVLVSPLCPARAWMLDLDRALPHYNNISPQDDSQTAS